MGVPCLEISGAPQLVSTEPCSQGTDGLLGVSIIEPVVPTPSAASGALDNIVLFFSRDLCAGFWFMIVGL